MDLKASPGMTLLLIRTEITVNRLKIPHRLLKPMIRLQMIQKMQLTVKL